MTDLRKAAQQAREALQAISDKAPAADPELTSQTSWGNYDDVFFDGKEQARYDAAEVARPTLAALDAALAHTPPYPIGARVRKRSGAWWEGKVCGYYSTQRTPNGVAVQMDLVPDGPVQIYPAEALEPAGPHIRTGPALDAALAAPETIRRVRHRKRGTTYRVIGGATLQAEQAVDGMPMVVYRADKDGRLWVRPVSEFEDGRFEEIDAALAAPPVDPAAIRRAALEEAVEAVRRAQSLDPDGFVVGLSQAVAAIRALKDKEPSDE